MLLFCNALGQRRAGIDKEVGDTDRLEGSRCAERVTAATRVPDTAVPIAHQTVPANALPWLGNPPWVQATVSAVQEGQLRKRP